MKILLFGKNGQVGWELQRALAPLGDVVALGSSGEALASDFSQPDALAATVRAVRPDVIVNAAAHTAVDRCESEPERAFAINAESPGVLARAAAETGAWLVHYSSDYVFDGGGSAPRDEDAPTGPLSVYGRSKLAGEEAIRASGCPHLILRTSWVYAARGGNFAKTMLKLAAERDALKVIADQIGAPTGADLLADVTAHLLRSVTSGADGAALSGTYHLAAGGETSWHGYARHVVAWAQSHGRTLRVAPEAVQAITTAEYPTPARRPLNSRLDTSRLRSRFGLVLPDWQQGVDRMLKEILS